MRFHEIINETVDELGIRDIVDHADETLPYDAADAITLFVGGGPGYIKKADGDSMMWGGVMNANILEDAFSAHPSEQGKKIRAELEAAFKPVREALRAKVGDSITLYRGQSTISKDQQLKHRNILSWTSHLPVAQSFAGYNHRVRKPYTDEQIQTWVNEFDRTGKVTVRGKTYVRKDPEPELLDYYKQLGKMPHAYYEIYDRNGEMVTDGDDLLGQFKDDQEWDQKCYSEELAKLAKVQHAEVPLDQIIWITDRFGQHEFMVKNTPNTSWHLPPERFVKK